jgi:hypothetical protein
MQKKILFATLMVFLLACNFLFPKSRENGTPPKVDPASPELTSPTGSFMIVRINKVNGGLMSQLASEAKKAKELDLTPFIEFDATWCPSCVAVTKSIKAGDASTLQALEGVYLIRADVDEWGWGDGKNFDFDAIPIYYQLDENGNPTGAVIDGGAWGEDIPENFGPVLNKFFHNQ